MGIVIPSTESNDEVDFFATRGVGSGTGVSKFGAGIQAGRLAYRLAKYGYQRYFGYATKTRSRAIGTATGAGIGLGGGLVATIRTTKRTTYNDRQTRAYMVKSRSKRQYGNRHQACRGCRPC